MLQFIKDTYISEEEVPKSWQSAGQNWMSKLQNFGYRDRKVNSRKFLNIDMHKIQ